VSEAFPDTEHTGQQRPSRGRTLAFLVLVVLLVAAPLIAREILNTVEAAKQNVYLIGLVLPVLSLSLAAAGVLILRRVVGKEPLDIIWYRPRRAEIVGTLLLILGTPIVVGLVSMLGSRLGLVSERYRVFYSGRLDFVYFVALTAFLVLPTPVIEELFWRGSAQPALAQAVGAVAAWVVQAALFAAVHFRPLGGFLPLLAFGLLTGLWRWRRRTLVPLILTHVVFNALWCAWHWPDWLEMSRIRITHDYSAEIAELTTPSPYDPNDDARYDYERARRTLQPLPDELDPIISQDPARWTPQQTDAARQWLAANAQALEHLARGAGKPYYCPDYRFRGTLFPSGVFAATERNLAFALKARIGLHAGEGREEEMVRDIATLYRFGTHFVGRKVLMDQLAGTAIRGMAAVMTKRVLAHYSFSTQTLDTLREQFQAFSDADDHVADLSLERLYCLHEIQRIFTDDGQGRGYVPETTLRASPGMTPEHEEAFLKMERSETTQKVEAFFEQIPTVARQSPWQLHKEPNDVSRTLQDLMRRNALLDTMGPAYLQAMDILWRSRTEVDAALALLAILRYETDHHQLPESLEQLVSVGHLKRLPRDNYSPDPLVYRWTPDGFLLYSWGLDFDDDGGTPSKWGAGEQGGDQVFWPIQTAN